MATKTVFAGAWVLALFSVCAIRAADPPALLSSMDKPAPVAATSSDMPATAGRSPYGPSDWITYHHADCCGPLGDNGPLNVEVYLRTGPSLPVKGELFAHTLETGWFIQGGGRTLFFNPEGDAAWTLDLSLANIYNNGNRPNLVYSRFGALVNTRSLNRTFVGVAGGREWYLRGPADGNGFNWRAGGDFGGRWGTARLDLNNVDIPDGFERHSHVMGGIVAALHTDMEVPWGCCVFQAGLRVEWDYTWMDFIPDHDNDLQDVNFLITAGIRF